MRARRAAAVLCVALLLAAGNLHLAHFYGLEDSQTPPVVASQNGASGVCSICATLHFPRVTAAPVAVCPVRIYTGRVPAPEPLAGPSIRLFARYIRPPPIA